MELPEKLPDGPETESAFPERPYGPNGKICSKCEYDNRPDAPVCRVCKSFLPGNTVALVHGAYSSLDKPEALAAIRDKVGELTKHLGGSPSVVQLDLAADYARLDTLINTVWANIEENGLYTAKGNARAAVSQLQFLMGQRLRLATALGIKPQERRIDLAQAFTDHAQAFIEHEERTK